ncbi:MAG: hypothetical protein NTU86_16010 [Burkholderiales bacterium]|nr:hypothetical protein [Burkholderiales bacterium]
MNQGFVTARNEATRQSMPFGRHCERSAAIHAGTKSWIATAFGLAMTQGRGLATTQGRGLATTQGRGLAMKVAVRFMERSEATRQSMPFGRHCERSAAIHAGMMDRHGLAASR